MKQSTYQYNTAAYFWLTTVSRQEKAVGMGLIYSHLYTYSCGWIHLALLFYHQAEVTCLITHTMSVGGCPSRIVEFRDFLSNLSFSLFLLTFHCHVCSQYFVSKMHEKKSENLSQLYFSYLLLSRVTKIQSKHL